MSSEIACQEMRIVQTETHRARAKCARLFRWTPALSYGFAIRGRIKNIPRVFITMAEASQ